MACCPYREYYANQAGGTSLPVFRGAAYQQGHGLGSLFSSLARFAVPLLKRGAKYLGRHALNTGVQVARDVLEDRRNWRDSAKHRLRSTANTIMEDVEGKLNQFQQQGEGYKKRKRPRVKLVTPTPPVRKRKRQRRRVLKQLGKKLKQLDIFSD